MKIILVDAAGTFVLDGVGVFKEMHELLEQYPNPKIILTNANDEQIPKYGLVNLPYPLFTLKHNPDKTDPEYFRKMLAHFGLQVEDVVYFEHTPAAVESARQLGITAYWYDAEKKDLNALKAFLDSHCV